ncbi:MAG: hypothetical protein HBSAPP03_22620 [Phycisphaerae bacterium]|nr:MAG: hypothetical protein HBSAPP03_22620 [Phycisphaerae bacterium]
MPGPHKTTPLFDLLSRGATTTPVAAPSKPVVRVELKPQAHGRPAESPPAVSAGSGGLVRLSPNAAYIAVAVTAVLVIVAYIVGFKVGTAKEAARAEKDLAAAFGNRPSITEPGTGQPQQPRSGNEPNRTPTQPDTPQGGQPQGNQPLLSTGPILSRLGSIPDPREPGKNYLSLAILPKVDCESAIRFLAANATDAIAVPLDSNGNEANNPGPAGRYQLFVLPGFLAGELRSSAAQALEAKVARLGPIWQKEHRGSSDFRMPQWYKKQ